MSVVCGNNYSVCFLALAGCNLVAAGVVMMALGIGNGRGRKRSRLFLCPRRQRRGPPPYASAVPIISIAAARFQMSHRGGEFSTHAASPSLFPAGAVSNEA